jgi:hypothetical protein
MNRRTLQRLAHDVGKYVARTARNLPPGPPDPELVRMLARDLYALGEGRRASAVLSELAGALASPALDRARALLAEADALEAALRAGDRAAVERGAAIAREVETLLRGLAEDAA